MIITALSCMQWPGWLSKCPQIIMPSLTNPREKIARIIHNLLWEDEAAPQGRPPSPPAQRLSWHWSACHQQLAGLRRKLALDPGSAAVVPSRTSSASGQHANGSAESQHADWKAGQAQPSTRAVAWSDAQDVPRLTRLAHHNDEQRDQDSTSLAWRRASLTWDKPSPPAASSWATCVCHIDGISHLCDGSGFGFEACAMEKKKNNEQERHALFSNPFLVGGGKQNMAWAKMDTNKKIYVSTINKAYVYTFFPLLSRCKCNCSNKFRSKVIEQLSKLSSNELDVGSRAKAEPCQSSPIIDMNQVLYIYVSKGEPWFIIYDFLIF